MEPCVSRLCFLSLSLQLHLHLPVISDCFCRTAVETVASLCHVVDELDNDLRIDICRSGLQCVDEEGQES